ncbi:MAG: recombinase family protein [Lachnospiraceae bacterium]|nr:recombinase family protein [Lachnospiraceae bacterium]
MARISDPKRLEKARWKNSSQDNKTRDIIVQEINETVEKNRQGIRKITVIEPTFSQELSGKIPKKRVAAYIRVSSQEDSQANSYIMQKHHFKRVINENPEYRFVKIYGDEGISGTSRKNRDGFNQMMEDCRAGKIDLILTKSISRFGRNIIDVLSSLEELSSLDNPVSVIFESEGIGTTDGKNSLIIVILSALAEMESRQKSFAIKEGIRYRMQEGIYKFGLSHTLGYYRDYTGRIKIEPAEAEIVKYIYDSFIEGATFTSIASALTTMGILSPTGNASWPASTVKSILSNEKYCGNVLYQKTYVKNFKTHLSVKNKGELRKWFCEDTHAPIISHEKWDKVQYLIANYHPDRRKVGARVISILPTFFRIKTGPLRGYYVLDLSWNKALRQSFIELMKNKA